MSDDIRKKYFKNAKPKKKPVIKDIVGLDIDKNEYQEIVLSNSSIPSASFKRK